MATNEILRSLTKVTDLVPSGRTVTIEGVPLYAGQPWSEAHELGSNILLPQLKYLLKRRACEVIHVEMIDDFTTGIREDITVFTSRMVDNPLHVFYESEFAKEAEEMARFLEREGKTIIVQGEVLLACGRMPRIRTRSDRASCELLDACFQRRKEGNPHIIIHPKLFVAQQAGMREILKIISGGELPAEFINIYFKNRALSRIVHTDRYGQSRNI